MTDQDHHDQTHHNTLRADIHVERCSECNGAGEIITSEVLASSYPPGFELVESDYRCSTCDGRGEFVTLVTLEGVLR